MLLQKIKSKRDPYFGRRVFREGSSIWLGNSLLIRLWVAISAANFATPIINAFYLEFSGINRGNIFEQGERIHQFIAENYFNVPVVLNTLNPFKTGFYMNILPTAWTLFFSVTLLILALWLRRNWKNIRNEQDDEFGGATLTEPFEMKQQYEAIPDRGGTFPGYGAVPVGHEYNFNSQGVRLYLATIKPNWMPKFIFSYNALDVEKILLREFRADILLIIRPSIQSS